MEGKKEKERQPASVEAREIDRFGVEDTMLPVYVSSFQFTRSDGVPETIALSYTPKYDFAVKYAVTVMFGVAQMPIPRRFEDWVDGVLDWPEDVEPSSSSSSSPTAGLWNILALPRETRASRNGRVLVFAPEDEGETAAAADAGLMAEFKCGRGDRDPGFKVYMYAREVEKEEERESQAAAECRWKMVGVFRIDEVGSTVFDMLCRTTAADRLLDSGCVACAEALGIPEAM